jgi:hypothetical protein
MEKTALRLTPGLKGFPGTNALAYFGDKEKSFITLIFAQNNVGSLQG